MTTLVWFALAIFILMPTPPALADKLHEVNCDKGQTIADALKKVDPGDTVRLIGTCSERVVIQVDGISLDGQGTAMIEGGGGPVTLGDGGVLVVDGAHRVSIEGLTIRNGVSHGINGRNGASFAVKGVTVQDNASVGIVLANNTTADITDTTVQRSGAIGINVFNTSTAVLRGIVRVMASRLNGIELAGGSTLELRGASVQTSDNGGGGLDIGASQVVIFGVPESQGSAITATGNAGDGIFVASGSLNAFGGAFAGSGTFTITSSGNGASGIALDQAGTVISPFGAAKFILENNVTGFTVTDQSRALIVGGLQVRNNHTGLLADGAGTLTLVSIPPNPSSIVNNSVKDVDLRFGTRATFAGVTVGTIVCDATVLSRGSTMCP
jgi:hypothetical protein